MVDELAKKLTAEENATAVLLREEDVKLKQKELGETSLQQAIREQSTVISLFVETTDLRLPFALHLFASDNKDRNEKMHTEVDGHEGVSFNSVTATPNVNNVSVAIGPS